MYITLFFPLQAQHSPKSRCKPTKSARLGNNTSPQPKTPAPTPDAEKRGPNTAGCPKPEEEAAATTPPTATSPTTTTGEAHAKRGSGPSNYTQALYKNARALYT